MNLNRVKPARRRAAAAHSLPEAIIAVLVIGVLLISLYAGFSSGFAIVRSAREDLRATQIILQRLETIRLYTWSQLQDTNRFLKPTFVEYYHSPEQTNETATVAYVGHVRANAPAGVPLSAPYRSNLLEITVTVYWTNYNGPLEIVRGRQMQTYVARRGMSNHLLLK